MRKTYIILLTVFLASVTLFGPILAPYPVDYSITMVEYKGETIFSPFGPNELHIAGTDLWGYDLLTRILYGFRYSVISVLVLAGLRVVLGLLLGVRSGMNPNYRPRPKLPFAVPAFIIVYFTVFRISIGSSLSISIIVLVQGVMIVLVGLPGLAGSFAEDIRNLMGQEFVFAARSLGADSKRILVTHLLPHLTGPLLQRFVGEAVSVLALLGQLSMFNVFLGGATVTFDPLLFHTRTFELAGMVGQYRGYLTNHQWLLIIPLVAYLTVLLSFFAISRLLERLLRGDQAKYS